MSFNWYKIAQIKQKEQYCLNLDNKRFAGVEIEELYIDEISSIDIKDIDIGHQFKYIGERIKEGKKREDDIIEKINELTPFILKHANDKEDINGIDAYFIGCKGKQQFNSPLTVQIKNRLKGGDDLGLEVVKGWPPTSLDIRDIEYNGKDMKTPVDYYFHIDRTGMTRIFNGSIIREVAQKMFNSASIAWIHNSFNDNRYDASPYGQILIVQERGKGGKRTKNNAKVIAYIDVNKLSPTYGFNLK